MADVAGNADGSSERDAPRSALTNLAAVPLEVVRLLKGDKLLLTAMGAASIVAVVAIVVPEDGWRYALVIAALVVVLVVVRAIGEWRRDDGDDGDGSSNTISGRNIRMRNGSLRSEGRNRLSAAKDVDLDGVSIQAGASSASDDPEPEPDSRSGG